VSGSRAAIVEGAVAALTFAPVVFALTFAFALILMLLLTFAPREHALDAMASIEIAKRIKPARMSVFFIVAFSEAFALTRDVVNEGGWSREGLKNNTR
jgi:hypothetical protein